MRGLILIFVSIIPLGYRWHINVTEAKPALSLLECSKTVEAEINTTIVLPCILKAEVSASFSSIEWVVNETTDVHLYRNKNNDLSEQMKDYRGRTSLFYQELSKGNFSLNLRAMQSHAGTYQCTVKIGKTKYNCSSELIFRAKETTNPSQDPRKSVHGKKTTTSPPNSDVTDFTTTRVVAVVVPVAAAAVAAVVFYFQICKKKTETGDVELNDPQSQNNNGGVSNLMENSSSNLSNAQQQQSLLQIECPSYQESCV